MCTFLRNLPKQLPVQTGRAKESVHIFLQIETLLKESDGTNDLLVHS